MLKAEVRVVSDLPRLFVNGEMLVPHLFYLNAATPQIEALNRAQVQAFSAQGMHLYSYAVSLEPCQRDFSHIEFGMRVIAESDPEAKVLLRVGLTPTGDAARRWGEKHPDDMMVWNVVHEKPYNNGMVNETSIVGTTPACVTVASDAWFEEAKATVHALHDWLSTNPYLYDHLLGYHIGCGETGEWFHYGLRERGIDYSAANERKYREYLRERYHSADALEKAWQIGRGGVGCFENVLLPRDLPGNDRMIPAERTLLIEDGDRRYMDYADYSSDLMADRIVAFARYLRPLAPEKLLVFFYGYQFELYDARTGHFRLQKALDCPEIDAFTSPVSYTERNHGGVGALMCPADGILRRGKLWIVEDDIRSPNVIHQSAKSASSDWVPRVNSVENYLEVIDREAAQMMAHGLGCWYMDLASAGWHHHPLIWNRIGELCKLYGSRMAEMRPIEPDVAVLTDERSLSAVAHADAVGANLMYRMRLNFYRAGVKFGLYAVEDFEEGRVPKSVKVAFYLTPFDVSEERAAKVNSVAYEAGVALVLMHAPGRTSDAAMRLLTGMHIRQVSGGMMPLHMRTASGMLAKDVEWLPTKEWGEQWANPAAYVERGDGIVPLAVYEKGALAGKTAAAWTSIERLKRAFVGALLLTPDAIRELCRVLGAPIYSETNDAFIAGNGVYALHTDYEDGVRVLSLPEKKTLESWPDRKLETADRFETSPAATKTTLWLET